MILLDTTGMKTELEAAGVKLDFNPAWDVEEVYNYIIHQYDITFLANKWEFVSDSRSFKAKGTRIGSGPYKGKFPPNPPKEK